MEKTPNPKCPRCKCYWKPDDTDIKTSGLIAKTCKKCRGRRINNYKQSIKKEDEPAFIKMNKCVICKELWERVDTEKVWESFECLKCYNCRSNGVNPDDIDISHEIYPVKKRNPVWKPDSSSESD
jgi:hypothetical protein